MNKKEKKYTPNLRFHEFQKTASWKEKELGQLFSERQETGLLELQLLSLTEKEGIIPQEETNRKNSSSADKSKYLRVCPNDIVYNTMRMWEGRSAIVNIEGMVSPAYTVCKPIEEIDSLFFSYYFKTQLAITQFHRFSQGLVKDTLNLKFLPFSKISLPICLKSEQQKIANCLLSIDDVIKLQSEKIIVLRDYKRGLIESLFPIESELIPRFRFPEFRNNGNWESKNLCSLDCAYFVKEKTPFEKLNIDTYVSTENLLSEYGGITKASKLPPTGSFTFYKKGDILVSNIRPYLKKVWLANVDGAASNDIIVVRAYSKLNKLFLSFVLKNDAFINYIMKGAKGVKMPRGDKSLIEKYVVKFPTKQEQIKIANCLSSIDDELDLQIKKMEELKNHRKGLMQQLFPKIN